MLFRRYSTTSSSKSFPTWAMKFSQADSMPSNLSPKEYSCNSMSVSGKETDYVGFILARTGRTTGQTSAEIRLVATLLAGISCEAELVCCSGATHGLVQLLDRMSFSRHGVQRPTLFDEIAIKKLMHKDNYSVFGSIDFFSVLQYLVVCLSGTLQMEWTLFTPELTKVRL